MSKNKEACSHDRDGSTRHRETAYCCGAGGLIRYDYDRIADGAGQERFRAAESTGADLLLTSCPACLMQFQQTRSKLRSRLRVMDITAMIWNQLFLLGERQAAAAG